MASLLNKSKHFNAKQILLSALLLFALLFSFASHSQHFELNNDGADQRCHLCQNKIDDVENKLEAYSTQLFKYLAFSLSVDTLHNVSTFCVTPPLRAPPVKY